MRISPGKGTEKQFSHGLFQSLYRKFTDVTAFSDTIEIYAVK